MDGNEHQRNTVDVTYSAVSNGLGLFAPRTVNGQSPDTDGQQRMVSARWQYDRHMITVQNGHLADSKWTVIGQ